MDQRLDPGEERLPLVVRLQLRAPLLALGVAVVPPERRVGRECADVGREDAEQVAEVALLQLDALGLVQLDQLVEPAGEDVVVALLDDQASIPPMHRYLSSSHSSIPYLEPSRPMPDSFMPPKGATSVEIRPVLMPTIPYSRPSETRQT